MSYQGIMQGKNQAIWDISVASKILQHMDRIRNASHEGQNRRWVWELIQNAKDCSFVGQPVNVKIELYDDRLVFSHNGRPFGMESLLALIHQVSSKSDENNETSGKFGTGFVTTHLLADVVLVSGVLQDFEPETGNRLPMKAFTMALDRSGTTQEEILESIQSNIFMLQQLDSSPDVAPDLEDFNTSFTYRLNSSIKKEIATTGMNDVHQLAPYLLAFSPEINEILLIDHVKSRKKELKRGQELFWDKDGMSFFALLETENGIAKNRHVLLAKKDNMSIVLPVDRVYKKFLPIPSHVPRIFSQFPLIGAENFPIPMICHHTNFCPDELRSSLAIVPLETSRDSTQNKSILKRAMKMYGDVLREAKKEGFSEFYHAMTFPQMISRPNFHKEWVETEINDTIYTYLKEMELFFTNEGLVPLKDSLIFPVGDSTEEQHAMWDILKQMPGFVLPEREELVGWKEALKHYPPIQEKHFFYLKNVVERLGDLPQIASAQRMLFLQLVYDTLMNHDSLRLDVLQSKIAIFPDQTNEMMLHTAEELFQDPGLEDSVKKALFALWKIPSQTGNKGYPIYKILLHRDFKLGESHCIKEAPLDDFFAYIDEKVTEISQSDWNNPENVDIITTEKEVIGRLLACMPNDYWLSVYRKFIYPDFQDFHAPSTFANPVYWISSVEFTLRSTAKLLEGCQNLERLTASYFLDTSSEVAFSYLKEFLEKAAEVGPDVYDYAIFPNQYQEFCYIHQLCNDLEISNPLKKISRLLVQEKVPDYGSFLLGLSPIYHPKIGNKTNADIAQDISRGIYSVLNHGDLNQSHVMTQEGCALLLSWIDSNEKEAEELFPAFFSPENRGKLLTPKTASILNEKVRNYENLLEAYGIDSLQELKEHLELTKDFKPEESSHIIENDDVFVDFYEHPELRDYTTAQRNAYVERLAKIGLDYAFDRLLKKWESLGFVQKPQDDEERVVLENLDNKVVLYRPDSSFYKQNGWDIAETVNQSPSIYYEIKSTVSRYHANNFTLGKHQTDLAFMMGENYRVLQYYMSTDMKKVNSCAQITDLISDLKNDQISFTGKSFPLEMNRQPH